MNLCMNELHTIFIINLSHIKFIMYNNKTYKSKGGSKSSFCVAKVVTNGVMVFHDNNRSYNKRSHNNKTFITNLQYHEISIEFV
jgi:hypothetical protein